MLFEGKKRQFRSLSYSEVSSNIEQFIEVGQKKLKSVFPVFQLKNRSVERSAQIRPPLRYRRTSKPWNRLSLRTGNLVLTTELKT